MRLKNGLYYHVSHDKDFKDMTDDIFEAGTILYLSHRVDFEDGWWFKCGFNKYKELCGS